MSIPGLGSLYRDVGTYIDLRAIGMVSAGVGYGVLGIVGTATRGPSGVVHVLSGPSDGFNIFRSGNLKLAAELAFGNGSDDNFVIRVAGAGAAKAQCYLSDGMTPPNNVALIEAFGEGGYGNGIGLRITNSGYTRAHKETFRGDGSELPYSLQACRLIANASNKVTVQGVKYKQSEGKLVYTADELVSGKVYLDLTTGKLYFYTGEWPSLNDEVSVYVYHNTLNIEVTLGDEDSEVFRDIIDLTDLVGKIANSSKIRGTIVTGETHLPNLGTYALEGGDDGDEIDTDDYFQHMLILGETLKLYAGAPTAVAFCECETASGTGTKDLIPIITEFAQYMADSEAPFIAFVGVNPEDSLDTDYLMDLAQTYQDRNLVIVGNPWDKQSPRRNGAIARAAKECAIPIGESAAQEDNTLAGMGDLYAEYNPTIVTSLTSRGVDILEKTLAGGIKPHMAITTSEVDQWKRTVDQKTINYIIVVVFQLTRKYRFKRNIALERQALKNAIIVELENQKTLKNIYHYVISVVQDAANPNKIWIYMQFIPIGHMEFAYVEMGVGVYEDLTNFAEV